MSDLTETITDGVAVLTLNRPDRLNALSQDMLGALKASLTRLATDDAAGAIVLTGAGRGFCAGGDVKDMANRTHQTFEERVTRLSRMHELPQMMRRHPKVIVAAVNGPAFGAGLGLAMACDIRIAARSARFGTAFIKIGYSGDFGGSWLLTQLVGPARARALYLTGEEVSAERAESIGLVTRVVDDRALMETALDTARRFAAGPRLALQYMKRNLNAAETETLEAVCDLEALHQARTGLSEDHREAVKAFAEKRGAVFHGR
ncbi:MAG TPA: enoyl-CoA hydratase [Acetobacteraceae bacterium]|nr:enoyl-CoA hydratase [Acetobacteraceae bacterium]